MNVKDILTDYEDIKKDVIVIEIPRAHCGLCGWEEEFEDGDWKGAEDAAVDHFKKNHQEVHDLDDDIDEHYDNFEKREKALMVAKVYVEPLVEKFPPEKYFGISGATILFHPATTYTVTSAEQVVNLMITVANWLLGED